LSVVNGDYGMASGFVSSVIGNNSSAIGAYSFAGGNNAVALGAHATASNAFPYNGISNATALGAYSTAGVGATASGAFATASGLNASAFGMNASATAAGSVAIGNGSIADITGTVSIGSSGAERRLVNLAAGTVSATSTDAINGGQFYAMTNMVATNTQDILANTTAIAMVNGRFALASQQVATSLGGGAGVDLNGYVSAPNYAVLGASYNNVGGALTALSSRVDTNSAAIAAIGAGGGTGLVLQDPITHQISVGSTSGGTVVNFAGTDGPRQLTGLAAGSLAIGSTDAVTGAQLNATNTALSDHVVKTDASTSGLASALGAGTQINANGTVTMPSYQLLGSTYNNIGGALSALGARADTNSAAIAAIGAGGGNGLILQDPTTQQIAIGMTSGGTIVNFAGTDGPRQLTGLAAGSLAIGSTDAVTGAQLNATNTALSDQVAKSLATSTTIVSVLGAGAQLNPDGTITMPSYQVLGNTYTSLAGALGAIDAAIVTNNLAVTQNTNAVTTMSNQLTSYSSNGRMRYASINSTGRDSSATGRDAVAFGSGATSAGNNAVAVGVNSVASRDNAIAVGNTAQATGVNAIAIGTGAVATGSVALGVGAQASNGGAALGDYAVATGTDSAALGPKSRATARNSVAIGAGSVATDDNVLSVGAPGLERRITNVAAGISSTDAVNVGQLNDVNSRLMSQIARVDGEMNKVRGGVAMAMAMSGGALPSEARGGVAVNVGTYGGQTALGVSHYIRLNNAVVLSGSVGLQDRQVGGRAGVMTVW
jgi:autotransporter adhesin